MRYFVVNTTIIKVNKIIKHFTLTYRRLKIFYIHHKIKIIKALIKILYVK